MNITIQSIHFDATERLQEYVQKKCDKLDQFYNRITDGQVYLKVTKAAAKENKEVEIKVNVPGDTLIASEKADTFEAATDLATEKVKVQLQKYKNRIRTH